MKRKQKSLRMLGDFMKECELLQNNLIYYKCVKKSHWHGWGSKSHIPSTSKLLRKARLRAKETAHRQWILVDDFSPHGGIGACFWYHHITFGVRVYRQARGRSLNDPYSSELELEILIWIMSGLVYRWFDREIFIDICIFMD